MLERILVDDHDDNAPNHATPRDDRVPTTLATLPHELKLQVARMVYLSGQATDPIQTLHVHIPSTTTITASTSIGSARRRASTALEQNHDARRALLQLCRVNRSWNAAARPYLFRQVHVGLP